MEDMYLLELIKKLSPLMANILKKDKHKLFGISFSRQKNVLGLKEISNPNYILSQFTLILFFKVIKDQTLKDYV